MVCKDKGTVSHTAVLFVTANAGLKLREQPDQNAKQVTLIPYGAEIKFLEEQGDPVTIAGKTGKWTKVSWKENTGWAFGGFLSETKPPDKIYRLSELRCGKVINREENVCWPAEKDSMKQMTYEEAVTYCGKSGIPSIEDFMAADHIYAGGFWTSDEREDGRIKIFDWEGHGDGGGGITEYGSDKESLHYTVCK